MAFGAAGNFCLHHQPTSATTAPAPQMQGMAIEAIRTWSGFQLPPGAIRTPCSTASPRLLLLCNAQQPHALAWLPSYPELAAAAPATWWWWMSS